MAQDSTLNAPAIPLTTPTFGTGQTPSPWFTVANQFLPRNLHDVIRWARYITIQSPVTTEVIRKFATYPITDFIQESKDEALKDRYKEVFKSLRLKQNLQNIGFEYFTIGNVFVSMYFPIHRSLICGSCKTEYNAKKAEFIQFKQYQFYGQCPKCTWTGNFARKDTKSLSIGDMNLIMWNPLHLSAHFNPITGESEYYYKIPNEIKRKIQQGDKLFVNSVPWAFIEAVRFNQDFKFDRENIFHLRNVSTGNMVEGMSIPPLISLFGLVFYQATLRKANESIATEHLTPMRVLFPQAQTANSDPVVGLSMKNFVSNMQEALQKHKQDRNHILLAPVPVGYQPIGGEGKNLLVAQEILQAEESILLALGVSRELLSGQTNWTSSTVGLRMLQNTLDSYVGQLEELITWVVVKFSSYLDIETDKVTLEPFKLMDDDNLKQAMIQLAQAGNVSLTSFYETFGMDFTEELEKMKEDAIARSVNTQETQFETEQALFLNSKKLGDKLEDASDYKKTLADSQGIANNLYGADPATRQATLTQAKIVDYPTYSMTKDMLEEHDQSATAGAGMGQEGQSEAGQGDGQLGPGEGGADNANAPQAASPALEQAMANENGKSQLALNPSNEGGGAKTSKSSSSGKPPAKETK